ncbi:MAG: TIR domain-containing protein [Fimbriimonadales bacterium]
MRPRVFIGSGSSPDRMRTSKAMAHRLQKDFGIIPKVWTYVFPPTESTLSSLVDMSRQMDFAVFVLGPDDLIMKSPTANPQGKGEPVEGETWTARDNVIFEMGLLIGTLGKERCFAVLPETRRPLYSNDRRRLHILTDYLGTTYCTYMATKEPGLDPLDAVFAACQEIGSQIEKLGPRPINAFRALFGSKTEAVVVYPHITAKTAGIYTTEHHGGSLDEEKHYWVNEPRQEQEIAHFDDLRAVNAIVELCGRMQVNVVATTDGSEQAEIQSLDTISFSIGLLNGLTSQAFEFIARDSENGIAIRHPRSGDEKRKQTSSVVVFNGYSYPARADESRQLVPPPDEERSTASTHAVEERSHPNFAILVRTFLRGGGGQPIPRFVCGGIEAAGTAAAGVYLKNHWKELLKYYEEFGKDLEQDSLAVILQFWGRKAESARPEVIRLSFFQPGDCEFYFYDHKTKGWKPEEKKSETGDRPDALPRGSVSSIQPADSNQASKPRANRRPRKRGGRN